MNFKQMLLLEELVDGIGSKKGMYKISFMMDNVPCTGDFRSKEDYLLQEGNEQEVIKSESLIDIDRLWKDYQIFIEDDKEYFIELSEHIEEINEHKSDKVLTAVFNNMVVFLMDKVSSLDDYLLIDNIPEVIHHLYKYNTYHDYYVVKGAPMEALSFLRVEQ